MMNIKHNVPSSGPVADYKWDFYIDENSTRMLPPNVDLSAATYVSRYLSRLSVSIQKILEVL
jgi:hypothetical protein